MSDRSQAANAQTPRHSLTVRVTHWLMTLAFFALLVSGLEILISHPRFYWGETGTSVTPPLFTLHIPSSRDTVPTGYNYILPDQNGWSRYLHFQAAWALLFIGFVYIVAGLWTGHLRADLLPARADRNWRALRDVFARHLQRRPAPASEAHSYNVVQRVTYLTVIFILFPLILWTGLALSPAFDAALPAAVNLLGGRQSARTLHFFVTCALVLFLVVHITMIVIAGFRTRMRAMISGQPQPTPHAAALQPQRLQPGQETP